MTTRDYYYSSSWQILEERVLTTFVVLFIFFIRVHRLDLKQNGNSCGGCGILTICCCAIVIPREAEH